MRALALRVAPDQKLGKWLPLTMAEQYRGLGTSLERRSNRRPGSSAWKRPEAIKH
jgi:hypothetical protein